MVSSGAGLRVCEVIPIHGHLRCPDKADGDEPALCKKHRREYGRSYWRYKSVSKDVARLARRLSLRLFKLRSAQDTEWAIAEVAAYIAAVDEEIRGRREHQMRFFLEDDDGHFQWMQYLENQKQGGKAFLEELLRVSAGRRSLKPIGDYAFIASLAQAPSLQTSSSWLLLLVRFVFSIVSVFTFLSLAVPIFQDLHH